MKTICVNLPTVVFLALVASCFSTLAAPPTAPGTPQGTVSGSRISLSWAAAVASDDDSVAGYNVYRNNQYLTTVTGTSWSGELVAEDSSVFYITAFNSAIGDATREYSIRSTSASFRAASDVTEPGEMPPASGDPADTRPTAPSSLSATRVSDGSVMLDWEESVDDAEIAGYNVYRDDRYITTVSTSPVTDLGLTAGQSYSYYLVAFDEPRQFSPRSNTAQANATPVAPEPEPEPEPDPDTTPDTEAPSTVGRIRVEFVSDTEVQLSWPAAIDNRGVDGYNIYRDGQYLSTVRDARMFTDSSLPENQSQLNYALVAFDVARNYSAVSSAITVGVKNPAPASSSNLLAPTGMSSRLIANEWVEFRWNPVADAVAYNIYRNDVLIYQVNPEKSGNENRKYWDTTSYIDCNFTRFLLCLEQAPVAGNQYRYHVRSVDSDGLESAPSEILTAQLSNNEREDIATLLTEFELVFEDDFNATSLDAEKWTTRLPWGPDVTINGELQYFVDSLNQPDFGYDPFILNGDTLAITGIPTPVDLQDAANQQQFLSGAITSRDAFNMTYGYVEARIKLAPGIGKLSSFYLFHQWAALNAPEIDIVEFLGEFPDVAYQTYHYRDERDGQTTHSSPTMFDKRDGVPFDADFHVYSVLWEPGLVVWFIDDEEVLRISGPEVSRQAMYITAYLVLGSEWTPIPDASADDFATPLEIDWIRAWQRTAIR